MMPSNQEKSSEFHCPGVGAGNTGKPVDGKPGKALPLGLTCDGLTPAFNTALAWQVMHDDCCGSTPALNSVKELPSGTGFVAPALAYSVCAPVRR